MTQYTIQSLLNDKTLLSTLSARLDVELLLAHVLKKNRSYLYTWSDCCLTREQYLLFQNYIMRRKHGEPIAYILKRQGFWSLDVEVSCDTLIPRPETEQLVELALDKMMIRSSGLALDLGTGTGIIALALAKECSEWKILGVDRVKEAIVLAKRNGQNSNIHNVHFQQSNWFDELTEKYHIITANPPYIAIDDPHLDRGDVRFEPKSALVAGTSGLEDLQKIIQQAPQYMYKDAWLLLEHGFDQADAVEELLYNNNFEQIKNYKDLAGLPRISIGQWRQSC